MKFSYDLLRFESDALDVEYFRVPWDSEILGFSVAQIERIEVKHPQFAVKDFARVEAWMNDNQIRLATCRLGHERLRESIFLEGRGYRFIEMVYRLRLDGIEALDFSDHWIEWSLAGTNDLEEIQEIASHAFATGRFNLDPRLGPELGGHRYAVWVENSFQHPKQRVYKATQNGRIAAFFITEMLSDGRVYWHLTAVAPAFQGQGVGKRAWQAMIMLNKQEGANQIETTISARNTAVVNLYGDLGFRFLQLSMTFHWWRG